MTKRITNTKFLLNFVTLFCLIVVGEKAYSKAFTNEYISFELPPGWECSLEGSEWVCQSENKDRKKESIIILVAKIRGPQDGLEQYSGYLKKAKTYALPGGKTQVSEPKYTKYQTITEQRWVDSLHLASEVPGFYTRYMATVKEDLGVAITFSVGKDFYSNYQGIFDKVVETLRVFRQSKHKLAQFKLKGKDENLLDAESMIPDEEGVFDISAQKQRRPSNTSGGGDSTMLLLLLGLAGGAFWFIKKKKQQNKNKNSNNSKDKT
jgi:hypothetical protein